jgi:anti-sigma factor RsiW
LSERDHDSTRIHEYFDAELDLAERRKVEAHLSECRSCRQELAWLKVTGRLIAEETVPIDADRLAAMRQDLLNRYDALLNVKQPAAADLKSRIWTNRPVRFAPRNAGRSEQWAELTGSRMLSRESASETPAIAKDIEVELPAKLKTARRQFAAEREDE